jgi:hypothetical protein
VAFTTVTVTRDYDLADGTDPAGTVTFTPTSPMVNGVTVVAAPVAGRLDVDGVLSIELAANTDPATLPTGSYYLVKEVISGATRSYYVQIPHDSGSLINLSTLEPTLSVTAPDAVTLAALLATKADNAAVVHNTGTETVAGVKTFTSAPVVPTNSFPETSVTGLVADLAAKQPLATLLTRLAAAPVTVTYAASVTLNASLGCVFRVTATGNLTLTDITNGVDGQAVALEVLASGADRTLTITGGGTSTVPSGQWWTGTFRYNAALTNWLLV